VFEKIFPGKHSASSEHSPSWYWRQTGLVPIERQASEVSYRALVDMLDHEFHFPTYYLYLASADKSLLWLEYMDLRHDATDGASAPKLNNDLVELLQTPEAQLQTDARFDSLGPIEVWAGTFLNIPLVDSDGQRVGALLVGPNPPEHLPRLKMVRLEEFAHAAGATIRKIKALAKLSEELRVADSRARVTQRVLGSALEVNRFVSLLLDLALTASRTEAGFVAIASENLMVIRASKNLPDDFLTSVNLTSNNGLFEWSMDANDVLILQDYEFVAKFGIKSILAVPLVEGKRLQGIFALINFGSSKTFDDQSFAILKNFCEQIRLVLSNAQLFEQFTERYLETLKALSSAYDIRSPYGEEHSKRVADLSVELGKALGITAEELDHLYLAAQIHDVGMCGVVEIKTGYRADFNHPAIGASLVEVLPISSDVANAIRTHHEWFDGWGFPEGLKGEAIPVLGRILAVAEYYEEIQSGPGAERMRSPAALAQDLEPRTGSQFDPRVVEALLRIVPGR
jgi:hypothetical protein